MTKLEIKAIKALPEEYCVDGLLIASMNGYVAAIETNLPPIIYKGGAWRHLTAENEPLVSPE